MEKLMWVTGSWEVADDPVLESGGAVRWAEGRWVMCSGVQSLLCVGGSSLFSWESWDSSRTRALRLASNIPAVLF